MPHGNTINFNMGCIETKFHRCLKIWELSINFNMGCIETEVTCNYTEYEHGLTLTWDVLKPIAPFSCDNFFWINFNMGCIETL